MPHRDPQYQGHIIDPDEEQEELQKIGGRKSSLLGGLILLSMVVAMIATSFWFKNFGLGAGRAEPTASSVNPFVIVPNASDFPLVTPSLPQDQPLSLNLGKPLAGWKLVGDLDSLSNTGEFWTTLSDQPRQVAVHLICYGYDEILVTLGRSIRTVDNPYLTQSAVFYCQPEGKDALIIFDQAIEGSFNQLKIMPMHYPANGQVDRWVAGIEEPLCGNYTGAFPGTGINICPASSTPAVASSPVKLTTTTSPTSGPSK